MTEYLNIIVKSVINAIELLTSPNFFILYIFFSFGIFRLLAESVETVERKLKMWKYNSYTFYLLFAFMQSSNYIKNNPDRWLLAVIFVCMISVLVFIKTRQEEKKISVSQ